MHQYGGSVISFAGDAIICWLDDTPASGDTGQTGAFRAVACALTMQKMMRCLATVYTPAGASLSLGIKVAVAAGPARYFLLHFRDLAPIRVKGRSTLLPVAQAVIVKADGNWPLIRYLLSDPVYYELYVDFLVEIVQGAIRPRPDGREVSNVGRIDRALCRR